MTPQIKEFLVNLPNAGESHKLSYTEWGSGERLLVCIHGLTRNGRDFDWLAAALANDYRVICPDMPGRGKSEWLKNPILYNNNYYIEIVKALVASLGYKQVDWVGTSMGGLMGMIAAATNPGLIRKMVLNDVGPFISADGMRRIATYIKDEVKFPSKQTAEQRFREIFAPFGITDETQWQHMFEYGLRQTADGQWSFNHDPKLGAAFKDKDGNFPEAQEFDLWRIWDAIKIPVLVLRGETSDILSREVAAKMLERPGTELVEFQGYGHVPPLVNDEQIGVVKKFLLGT
jgi:pimeloyl-ACP methyl ester carboxylesterase